ncbi:alpha/beta hydrolase fold domain-containing protein [Streptomyces sp. ME08-AFT2]|uniref:alpha/beta hydrolase fold domain-containing protein n=1 Tax=Streptomyces sp. ME08-AFT2 TaxID=3028683 RepID=UPI0029BBBDDF|nr:alpha/beta hydrolase fold domain-containing protein [Streptomyces sp. ME08-AFT2]MDX3312477.1 alpha/beta hydrolase fold domain-containing protein [Streptomyces sp. ME08-AFT2]
MYEPDRPVDVRAAVVPGPEGAAQVPVRIYTPVGAEEAGSGLPGLVYLHGGGYVLGSPDFCHSDLLRIADQVGALVVSVDYRLAPEHPFPAGLEDSYAALVWTAGHATELGIDPARRRTPPPRRLSGPAPKARWDSRGRPPRQGDRVVAPDQGLDVDRGHSRTSRAAANGMSS